MVLILILLEVGLLVGDTETFEEGDFSLNPYSTGSWVAGLSKAQMAEKLLACLNPYSTGSWVAGILQHWKWMRRKMSLNPYSTGSWVAGYIKLL